MKFLTRIISLFLLAFTVFFHASGQEVVKLNVTNLKLVGFNDNEIKTLSPAKNNSYPAYLKFNVEWLKGSFDKVNIRVLLDGAPVFNQEFGTRDWQERPITSFSPKFEIPGNLSIGQHQVKLNITKVDNQYTASKTLDCPDQVVNFQFGNEGTINSQASPAAPSVAGNAITIELNPATGKPYEGVVTDGFSSLKIEINTGSSAGFCNFNLSNSQGGIYMQAKSDNTGSQQIVNRITLNNGKAVVYYHPPQYISDQNLMNARKPMPASSNGSIYGLNVPVEFSFTGQNGQNQTQTLNIAVYRPPVMFVHGFTGSKETWTVLQNELQSKKFDAYADDYYQYDDGGYQTIDAQSMLLGELISARKKDYSSQGIKVQKFDVICHSMGGLFARNYVHGFPSYGNDVRKLIMLATPNHGIEWWNLKRTVLGALAALGMGQHQALAAEVRSISPTMKAMNAGEDQGKHLNYNVQYGNVFVSSDDLVVSGTSARLSGVANYPLQQKAMHSVIPQVDMGKLNPFGESWLNVAITEFTPAINRVLLWLTREMDAPTYYKDKIMLTEGEGSVSLGNADSNGNYIISPVSSFPKEVTSYVPVITGSDSKKVTLKIQSNGKEWATILIAPNTELFFRNYSQYRTDVNIKKGKARFICDSSEGGFNVIVTPFKDGNEFYSATREMTFYPRAVIRDLDTDFIVEVDDQTVKVSSFDGRIVLENGNDQQATLVNTKEAVKIDNFKNISKDVFNQSELESVFTGQKATLGTGNSLFANVTAGGKIVDSATLGGGSNQIDSKSTTSATKNQSCMGQLQVQFIQKTGAVADAQAKMIMMKIDDENKRELYWFNQAADNYKSGVVPREISGTYRRQQNAGPLNREYYSETVTLFEPMKIGTPSGTSHGFMIMKDSNEFKRFGSNQEAQGVVLPCGSYKVYPNNDLPFASTKLPLGKVD